MWCKVCRKHEHAIRKHTDLKGQALDAALKMVRGTNYVTKFQVRFYKS